MTDPECKRCGENHDQRDLVNSATSKLMNHMGDPDLNTWIDETTQQMLVDYTDWVNGQPVAWNVKKAEFKQSILSKFEELEKQARANELEVFEPLVQDHAKCIDSRTCIGYMQAKDDFENGRKIRLTELLNPKPTNQEISNAVNILKGSRVVGEDLLFAIPEENLELLNPKDKETA